MEKNIFLSKITENSNIETKSDTSKTKKEYELIKDNIIFLFKINYYKKDSNNIIKIKTSQIFNNNFYLYEQIIDLNYLIQIFKECESVETGYSKLITLFDNKKVKIQNIINDKSIILYFEINTMDNFKIELIKINKEENKIIKKLIAKYNNLEKEYIEMKNNLTKENNSLKLEIENLKKNNQKINTNYLNSFNLEYSFNKPKINRDINEIQDDEKHITLDCSSSVWCMLNLNKINYQEDGQNLSLNLVAIGLSNSRIYVINVSTMKTHQIIKGESIVYSLSQFSNSPKYLFSSFSNGFIGVYILKGKKYEEIQKLQKPSEYQRGEINKVITLSNGDLASGDRKSITIWKQKKNNLNEEFEFYKELITHYDTCHLIEVNKNIFACSIYTTKTIKIFNNDRKDYPLLGEIINVESNGNNSNGMSKINDRLFVSCGKGSFIYIVCVDPIQLIQKIELITKDRWSFSNFVHINNGFLFTLFRDNIMQYKIITDENNNFIEFKETDIIKNNESGCKAITTTDDGKIFYQIKGNNLRFYFTEIKKS